MSKKILQRILIILSSFAFIGSTGVAVVGLFTSAMQPSKETAKTAPVPTATDSQLQAQERGYELVLQREPENQVALEGLVKLRLQTNKLQDAIAPLEKLVKLNPDRESYKALLAEVKQRAGVTDEKSKRSNQK